MTDDQGWGDTGYNGHPSPQDAPPRPNAGRRSDLHPLLLRRRDVLPHPGQLLHRAQSLPLWHHLRDEAGMLEPTESPHHFRSLKNKATPPATSASGTSALSPKKRAIKNAGAPSPKQPERYYCPPWERDVDVSFVTESKVPTWDPPHRPRPDLKKKKSGDANPSKDPTATTTSPAPAPPSAENTKGDDSRVIMDRALPFIRGATEKKVALLCRGLVSHPRTPRSWAGQNIAKLYHDQPEHAQHYYACLTAMDEQIGRLRAELKSLGIADNTMICFCSDNGPARQGSPRHVGTARNLKGLQALPERRRHPGSRPHGLARAKIKEPRTVTAPCFTSDYFPTILAALEVSPPRRPDLRRRRHPPLRHRQADRA